MMGKVAKGIVPGLLLVALYYAVFGGEYSLFELQRSRVAVDAERATLRLLREDLDSLSAWADSLRSDPVTLERVARERFGLIRDGEILYRFAEPTDTTATGGAGPAS